MKQIPSSEFRKIYARVSEPVEVKVFDEVIGTWFPNGSVISSAEAEQPPVDDAGSEHRMTIRPMHPRQRRLTSTTKRILDPVKMREQAQVTQDEIHPRQFITKRVD